MSVCVRARVCLCINECLDVLFSTVRVLHVCVSVSVRCGSWCPHWSLSLSSLVCVRPFPPPYRRFGWPLVGPCVLA